MKAYVHTKTCTQMFLAALFTIAKKQKQPKRPSVDEQINKMWSIHTVDYHSAVRRSEALMSLQHDGAWKHDATRRKAGPEGYTLIPCRGNVQKVDECQGPEAKRRGSNCLKGMAFPFGMKKMFWN